MNEYLHTEEPSFVVPPFAGGFGDVLVGEDIVHEAHWGSAGFDRWDGVDRFGGSGRRVDEETAASVSTASASAWPAASTAACDDAAARRSAPSAPVRPVGVTGQRVQQSNARSQQMGGMRVTNRFFVRRQFS